MTEAVVTTTELQARLDWDMDAGELKVAQGALDDLSDDARFYGKLTWADGTTTPEAVKNLVLRAAARYMRNPDGYTQSRAGDETLMWNEDLVAVSPEFTDKEIRQIGVFANVNRSGFVSVETVAWGPVRQGFPGFVPVAGSDEKPFPMFSDDVSPW